METPIIPEDEQERLRALMELALLDTPPEAFMDECVRLAGTLCGVRTAAITLVDQERQWFKAVFGRLPAETTRDVSFCGHTIAHDDVLIVEDAHADPRFADNPLVVGDLRIRFYAGVPLHGRDGQPYGTLCLIHDEPYTLDREQVRMLRLIADKIEEYLTLRIIALKAAALEAEARSRERALRAVEDRRRALTAMFVHDLKNPLAAAAMTAEYARGEPQLTPRLREALQELTASVEVMQQMVLDTLDVTATGTLQVTFARFDLRDVMERLIRRLRYLAADRDQAVELEAPPSVPITADSVLVSRAVRNMLDNAFKYAPRGRPVRLVLRANGDAAEIRVEDEGPVIPESERGRIFDRHVRLSQNVTRPGHGLGLAFCDTVARAHRGSVWVEPTQRNGNAFVLRIPRGPQRMKK